MAAMEEAAPSAELLASVQELKNKGNQLFAKKKFPAALVEYQQAAAKLAAAGAPADSKILSNCANTKIMMRHYPEAAEYGRASAAADPDWWKAHLYAAQGTVLAFKHIGPSHPLEPAIAALEACLATSTLPEARRAGVQQELVEARELAAQAAAEAGAGAGAGAGAAANEEGASNASAKTPPAKPMTAAEEAAAGRARKVAAAAAAAEEERRKAEEAERNREAEAEEKRLEAVAAVERGDHLPLKAEGDAHVEAKRYQEAIAVYTKAIDMLELAGKPDVQIVSMRALAHQQKEEWWAVANDGLLCMQIDPDWWTGYYVRAHAIMKMLADKTIREANNINADSAAVDEMRQAIDAMKACLKCSTVPPEEKGKIKEELQMMRAELRK